jgi:hypothetical protein
MPDSGPAWNKIASRYPATHIGGHGAGFGSPRLDLMSTYQSRACVLIGCQSLVQPDGFGCGLPDGPRPVGQASFERARVRSLAAPAAGRAPGYAGRAQPSAARSMGRPRTRTPSVRSLGRRQRGIFANVPGLDFGYRMLTRVLPLGRVAVTERDGELYISR